METRAVSASDISGCSLSTQEQRNEINISNTVRVDASCYVLGGIMINSAGLASVGIFPPYAGTYLTSEPHPAKCRMNQLDK